MLHANRFKFEGVFNKTVFRFITTDAGLKFDVWLVRHTGFSLLYWTRAKMKGLPYRQHLLMTTIGAKTGLPRDAVLPFFREGDDYVVIGSNAGADKDPGWIANIKANPDITVRVSGRLHNGTARIANAELRPRLYARACEMDPIFFDYERGTSRVIPAVLLTLNRG